MAAALLSQRAGIKLLQIPYAGTAAAVKDVLGGEIPLLFTHLATVATLIRDGQLRALAVTGPHRAAAFPDVPTVAESGFPGFDVVTWHGVLAPPGTPREIVMRLHRELARILAMDDFRAQLANLGMEPLGGTPEEFAADIKADRQRWATVIRERCPRMMRRAADAMRRKRAGACRPGQFQAMSEPLLMVSTASQWLGPARMARALAKADFDVALLAPADSLAAKSKYIAKRRVLPGNAIPMEWLQSLTAAIDDLGPRLLVPCDEMAIRLLFALVLEPPRDLPSASACASKR